MGGISSFRWSAERGSHTCFQLRAVHLSGEGLPCTVVGGKDHHICLSTSFHGGQARFHQGKYMALYHCSDSPMASQEIAVIRNRPWSEPKVVQQMSTCPLVHQVLQRCEGIDGDSALR